MNTDTGELRRITEEQAKALGLTNVPKELMAEAEEELGDKESVMVDMSKDSPLVQWAKSVSQTKNNNKKKIKNKMAKKSRKINRKK